MFFREHLLPCLDRCRFQQRRRVAHDGVARVSYAFVGVLRFSRVHQCGQVRGRFA